MHGDAKAVQPVRCILLADAAVDHVPGDMAVRFAGYLLYESPLGIFSGTQAAVARQKMERNPYLVVGEFLEIAVVEHLVGRSDPIVHGAVMEMGGALVGGIIHVLGTVGDYLRIAVGEARMTGNDVSGGVVEIDLHNLSSFPYLEYGPILM